MKDTNSSLFFLFPMWYGTLTARPFNLSPTFVEYVAGSSKKRMAGMWCVKSWNLTSLNPDLLYTANPESVKTVSNFFCFWSNIFRESICKYENKEKLKEDSKIKKKRKKDQKETVNSGLRSSIKTSMIEMLTWIILASTLRLWRTCGM